MAAELQTATSLIDASSSTTSGSSAEWESLVHAEAQLNAVELEERNQALRQRLGQLQAQRRRTHQQQRSSHGLQHELQHQLTAVTQQQQHALQTLVSCRNHRLRLQEELHRAERWNVLSSDAFHIDVNSDGCATINNLRLGGCVVTTTTQQQQQQVPTAVSTPNTAPSAAAGFFSFVGVGHSSPPPPPAPLPHQSTTEQFTTVRIPWREINAALGQVALLLSVLEQSLAVPPSNNNNEATATAKQQLFRYELQVLGSTSKIGVRTARASAATSFYNLYFAQEGFPQLFFGKRNFNTALTYLADCVQSAAELLQQRGDGTMVLPHAIETTSANNNNSNNTCGGLSIHYFNLSHTAAAESEDEHLQEWTRAMKYLLTNVKHLMVYRGVGLWSST